MAELESSHRGPGLLQTPVFSLSAVQRIVFSPIRLKLTPFSGSGSQEYVMMLPYGMFPEGLPVCLPLRIEGGGPQRISREIREK